MTRTTRMKKNEMKKILILGVVAVAALSARAQVKFGSVTAGTAEIETTLDSFGNYRHTNRLNGAHGQLTTNDHGFFTDEIGTKFQWGTNWLKMIMTNGPYFLWTN